MSTTQSASGASTVTRDLRDLYDLLIFDDPEICAHCHARIRDRETHDTNTLGTGNRPDETLVRVEDGVMGYDVEIKDAYGAKRNYVPRTFCDNCGSPGGIAEDRTLGRWEMLNTVPNLVARFDRAGIPINPDRLLRYISHLRSQERFRGAEHEIWRVAVEFAVRNARIRDCVRATYGTNQ